MTLSFELYFRTKDQHTAKFFSDKNIKKKKSKMEQNLLILAGYIYYECTRIYKFFVIVCSYQDPDRVYLNVALVYFL